ncbi:MAG: dihydroorotase [Betaproteobacteria bacterium]|nr:dihydroorotase [Betaproteobacteria bacterium]
MRNLISREWPGATQVMEAEIERHHDTLHAVGFRPSFYDHASCTLYPSRHADGSPADNHVLDGLPDEVVVVRACNRVLAVRMTLVAGFERGGYFFTKAAALRAAVEWNQTATLG